jgi:hypothetical protein
MAEAEAEDAVAGTWEMSPEPPDAVLVVEETFARATQYVQQCESIPAAAMASLERIQKEATEDAAEGVGELLGDAKSSLGDAKSSLGDA